MAEKSDIPNTVPWPALFTAAIVVSGLVYYLVPLSSSRPQGAAIRIEPVLGYQDAEARLWQDPLEAAESKANEPQASADDHLHSPSALREQLQAQKKVILFPVFVEAGRYAESGEVRRRARNAVLSGLAILKYVPRDVQHVGFVDVTWPRFAADLPKIPRRHPFVPMQVSLTARAPKKVAQSNFRVPYEWFDSRGSDPPVLVLWLDEAAFSDRPLRRLASLISLIRYDSAREEIQTCLDLRALAPRTSTLLALMAAELANGFEDPAMAAELSGAQFYSPTATAEERFLTAEARGPWAGRMALRAMFQNRGISFERTTPNDRDLAIELVAELRRRGIDVARQDRVALISEWDTFYGRSLPDTFASAAQSAGMPGNPSLTILRFSYLRGIDGIQAGQEISPPRNGQQQGETASHSTESSSKAPTKSSFPFRTTASTEAPDGPNQYDYLRRLASELRQQSDEVSGRPIKAIGVLGSDLYDKLLILQALRQEFPNCTFFTTDLDARFAMEQSWTHNLIVASPFGLTLDRRLQSFIPPFRDDYQTSTFCATLRAFKPKEFESIRPDQLKPRLFEIGRTGPIDISADGEGANIHMDLASGTYASHPLYPVPIDALGWWTWQRFSAVFAATIFFIALFVAILTRVQVAQIPTASLLRKLRFDRFYPHLQCGAALFVYLILIRIAFAYSSYWFSYLILLGTPLFGWLGFLIWRSVASEPMDARAYAVAVLCAILFWECVLLFHNVGDKPFHLFQGVSIWPTEAIRTFAILFSFHFLIQAASRMRKTEQKLEEAYGLGPEDDSLVHKPKAPKYVNARAWWAAYRKQSGSAQRARRCLATIAAFSLLAVAIVVIFGVPRIQYRGSASMAAEWFIVALSVLAQVTLTFYVVDACQLAGGYIEKLAEDSTAWPSKRLEHEAKARGMQYKDLDEYIDIRFIAELTRPIMPLIYYPFIVMALMILARMRVFDDWDWPLTILLILGLNIMIAIVPVNMMRRGAEAARTSTLKRLRCKLLELGGKSASPRAFRLSQTIREIKDIREGAFTSVLENPVLGALLLPSGAGLLVLLDYFVKMS